MFSFEKSTVLVAFLTCLSACASIDLNYPRSESTAFVDTDDTYLGKRSAELAASKVAGQSGFYPLPDGTDALAMRLLLARRAERSIDLQYYLIADDVTGRAMINALLDAADRGVRVRLLLDDIFTSGYDAGMAGLDSHPNFEIRIFNPFHRGFAGRLRSGLTSFRRINRRMHNKSFTVDSQVTVIGGRNIADEYFGARVDAKFSDLDVAGIGAVATDVSAMFDAYWNHETALPIPAFAKMPDDPHAELERLRRELANWREEMMESPYADAARQRLIKFIETGTSVLRWAPYSLVYDAPDKGVRSRSKHADTIRSPLVDSLQSAEKELVILSPYFVPRNSGVERFSALQRRGVQVTVVTNSLAANNQFIVHSGYAPSRKKLLRHGIKIYEVRSDAEVEGAELIAAGGAKATLHTKAFLVDDKELFVGSFNFDPRSAFINTESGVIIRSVELARDFAAAVANALPRQTYEVFLNEKGQLRWRDTRGEKEVIWDREPQTTWRQRFMTALLRILPIRDQL